MPHLLQPRTALINAQLHQQPTAHNPDPLAAGKIPRLPAVPRGPVDAAAVGRPLHPVAVAAGAAAAAAVAADPPSRRLSDDWFGADCGNRLRRQGH